MKIIYVIFDPRDKTFLGNVGYYGNEQNIRGFTSRDDAEKYIKAYCSSKQLLVKRMKIK